MKVNNIIIIEVLYIQKNKCSDDNIKIHCKLIKQKQKPKLEEKMKTHFLNKNSVFYYKFKVNTSFKIEKDFS